MKCFHVVPFLLLLSLCSVHVSAQNQPLIDSLEATLNQGTLDRSAQLDILEQLANLNQRTDYERCLAYSRQLLDLGKLVDNKTKQATAYKLIGWAMIDKQEDLSSVVSVLDTGIMICEAINDTSQLIGMYATKARVYMRDGFYGESYDYYQKGLAHAEQIRDTNDIIIMMNNMSLILKREERYERAKAYYRQAIAYAEHLRNNKRYLAALNNNLGSIYDKQDSADLALPYYEKSLALKKELNDRYSLITTLLNVGVINLNKEKFDLANSQFEEGYLIARELDNKEGMALLLTGWATYFRKKGEYQTALDKLLEAKELLGKNGDLYTQMQCHDQLSQTYEVKGDYQEAFESYRTYNQLQDSIYQRDSRDKIDELETKYKVRQTETENKLLKAEQEAAAINSRNAIIIAIGLFVALILALGWVYSIFKAHNEKKRMNVELERKVEERTQDLKDANVELQQLNHELKTYTYIASHDLKEPIRNIGNFVGLIQHKIPKDISESVSSYFSMIRRSTAQLYSLVEDFSEYSSLSKETVVDLEEVDLNLTAQNLRDHFTALLKEKNGQFSYDALPVLQTSSSMIFIALKNLVENGLKFNDSDRPTVEISYKSADDTHQIIVTDNGIGIDPQYHEMIFDMFKRLHDRHAYHGSGIGLSITKLMVQKINGEIHLESELGKGSTFIIELPK